MAVIEASDAMAETHYFSRDGRHCFINVFRGSTQGALSIVSSDSIVPQGLTMEYCVTHLESADKKDHELVFMCLPYRTLDC